MLPQCWRWFEEAADKRRLAQALCQPSLSGWLNRKQMWDAETLKRSASYN